MANNEVRGTLARDQVVGFIAASDESIAQFYLHAEIQGSVIEKQILQWAKDRSSGRLWLYTVDRKTGAQRFYEKRGFRIGSRGLEESWQLADIRYE